MLIHWRASSQWLVPMPSPSSGREASSITGERRLPGTSLEACGTRALIEALSRSFFDAIHVEEYGTRIGPLSATFRVSLHYKFCAIPFLEKWRWQLNRSSRSWRVWDVKLSGLQNRWRRRCCSRTLRRAMPGSFPRRTIANRDRGE